jgi:uncharacterized membrane protein
VSVVEASIDIDAPPEQVWRVVANPNNLPRWDRHVADVHDVPSGGLRTGSEYSTEIRLWGVRARARAHVVELRDGEYAKVRLRGPIDALIETWVEPRDGNRAHLRHRVEYRFPGGPLGELAGRAVGRLGANAILRRGVEAQKRQVERSAA